ncbi:MAG TPA: TetR/AcrR family transcriptional regulator [Solirubrobacteraceae bacterium]|nr:TetR/AcrR family transcriptional regulator [Solirubrobacteraceae bacterium]
MALQIDPAAQSPPRRRMGRPPSAEADRAILETARRQLVERGYAGMSIAGIAEGARVGRPTVYRRYRDKADVVAAAIEFMPAPTAPPDTGAARADLLSLLEGAARSIDLSLVGSLLVEERRHPELMDRFRERTLRPYTRLLAEALDLGRRRGDVRADLDPALAAEVVLGAFLHHHLLHGRPTADWAEQVLGLLWPCFAAPA